MMRRNPEFQRQLWLHWSPMQLVWMVLFVALAAAAVAALSPAGDRIGRVLIAALGAMCVAPLFPGAGMAGKSLQEEMEQNTWDWQHLSAIGPWPMAWGKWLGSTVTPWLFAACCGVLAWLLTLVGETPYSFAGIQGGVWKIALLVLIWGLALQAFALATVPIGAVSSQRLRRLSPGVRVALLVMLAWGFSGPLLGTLYRSETGASPHWWHWPVGYYTLALGVGVAALLLNALALWRTMCMRLDVPVVPWAMAAGCAWAAWVLAGLYQHQPDGALWALCTAALALAAAAGAALLGRESAFARWRQWHARLASGQARAALQVVPLWLVCWVFSGAMLGLAWLLDDAAQPRWHGSVVVVLLLWLHGLRDAGFLTLALFRTAGSGRKDVAVLFVWISITFMLPLIVIGALGGQSLAWLVWLQPLLVLGGEGPGERLGWQWLSLVLQSAIVWQLARLAYRKRVAQAQPGGR